MRESEHGKRRRRSRSPRKEELQSRDKHRPHRAVQHNNLTSIRLPYNQAHLRKRDLDAYKDLFASYLDIQKNLDLHQLDNDEVKGRWKSFLNKWNAGHLAEGWYDPTRLAKSQHQEPSNAPRDSRPSKQQKTTSEAVIEDAEDDDYGPELPPRKPTGPSRGPTIPGFQDLQHKRETELEDRSALLEQQRLDRKHENKAQRERLEELVPRADPGSRERQREKKQNTAMTNRAFAAAKDSDVVEIADADLMGDGGIDAYKAEKRAEERHKNQREIHREELLRARAAEREEKLAEHRQKEEKTMETLRALAKERYG